MPRHAPTPVLTVVFSSRQVDQRFVAHIRNTAGIKELVVLGYDNPGRQSLTAVYNQGLLEARSDVVVFVHDDVRFDTPNWGRQLLAELGSTRFGILGVAGTTDLVVAPDGTVAPWWQWQARCVGRVTHERAGRREETRYSNSFNEPLPVVCVDGVFIAVHRKRISVPFDERLSGFHFYDISFCLANHSRGVPVGVTFSIRLTHYSTGTPGPTWDKARRAFSELYASQLPRAVHPERLQFQRQRITPFKRPQGLVSVLVHYQGDLSQLKRCIAAINNHTQVANFELIVVAPNITAGEQQRLEAIVRQAARSNAKSVRVLGTHATRAAQLCNEAADQVATESRYLLFCDPAVEIQNDAVDRCLRLLTERQGVGTVGIRLHRRDCSVADSGLSLRFGLGGIARLQRNDENSYYSYASGQQKVTANNGRFLMLQRSLLQEIAFNDAYETELFALEFSLAASLLGRSNYLAGDAVGYLGALPTDQASKAEQQQQARDLETHFLPFFKRRCVPAFLPDLFAGASLASRSGDTSTALEICDLLLQHQPQNADLLHLKGVVLARCGQLSAAHDALTNAIRRNPKHPAYYFNLGETLRLQGQWKLAEDAYRRTLGLAPDTADAHWRLAQVLAEQGQLGAALRAYEQTLRAQPAHPKATLETADLLLRMGKPQVAMGVIQKALERRPDWSEGHHYRGMLLASQRLVAEAEAAFRESLKYPPQALATHFALGAVLERQGKTEQALSVYQDAIRSGRVHPLVALRVKATCPDVFQSAADIITYRQRVADELAELRGKPLPPLDFATLSGQPLAPPAQLIYQGLDDRALRESWATACRAAMPRLESSQSGAATHRKPQIGFLVTQGHEGPFIRTTAGILERLDTARFDLVIIGSAIGGTATLQQAIKRQDVRFLTISSQIDQAVTTLLEAGLSVLYYWEIGTDSQNYFLPFFRLAPVQCTGWGWPVTSGIDSVDFYISSEILETDETKQQFTEDVVCLPRLPVWVEQPAQPSQPINRNTLGLPEGPIYLCCQNTNKIHPDFDSLLERILARDSTGIVVFISRFVSGGLSAIDEQLKTRLDQRLGKMASQVHWLPRLPFDDYLSLVAEARVVLDVPHFGAGITAYDAFAVGTPVVTLPGNLSRSRYACALYRQMGIEAGIAKNPDEYVDIALQLAKDATSRAQLSADIKANASDIFSDAKAIPAFQGFLDKTIESLPTGVAATNEDDERSPWWLNLEPTPADDSGETWVFATLERAALNPEPVAIVVPVHNAAQATEACLESILRETTSAFRLIVIDDASTDTAIRTLLRRYQDIPQVDIHHNPENLGYTATINRGIRLAGSADVVLLNSDTRVTPGWLTQLRLAAYSGERVGSATAISNNAGAFSVPLLDHDNPVPARLGVAAYGRAIAQTALRNFPQTPTGNGFCFFLRRDCINAVGLFDEDAFRRGYGEENDFCMRALSLGWRHVVDDATWVAHQGSASLAAEKNRLYAQGSTRINERYPEYNQLTADFVRSPAMQQLRKRAQQVTDAVSACPGSVRPRALSVLSNSVGGTAFAARDLMNALEDDYEPFVLWSDTREVLLQFGDRQHLRNLKRKKLTEPTRPFPHRNRYYDQVIADWLVRYKIELIHIHHIAWHSLGLIDVAHALGCPVLFSFHDFYAVCPTVNLIDDKETCCFGHCTDSRGDCQVPLWPPADVPPLKHAAVYDWRRAFAQAFDKCTAFVAPSMSARQLILNHFPGLQQKLFPVIAHGQAGKEELSLVNEQIDGSGPVRVLVPGNLSAAKGAQIVAAFADLAEPLNVEIHILGPLTNALQKALGERRRSNRLKIHGPYERNEFSAHVSAIQPHLGLIPSIAPETFSYTLTELWSSGLPVIGFAIGAIGDRIGASGAGWALPEFSADAIGALISRLRENPTELHEKRQAVRRWQATSIRTCAEMADDYAAVYREICSRSVHVESK